MAKERKKPLYTHNIHAKIGTHSSALLRVQGRKREFKTGDEIKAMLERQWTSLHPQNRNRVECLQWIRHVVDKVNDDGIVFLYY